MALSYVKQTLYQKFFYSKSKFRERMHVLADGEKSAYFWLERDHLLPPTAPILFIVHTICGQISHFQILMDYCVRRGWRPCALMRRGHLEDKPLSRPCFNLLGEPDDTHSQVKAALGEYPDAEFAGMIGLSAGAALIANYLGKFGNKALVQAGCCVCPAYDLEYAFQKIYTQQPTLDGYVLGLTKKLFLEPNSKLLSESYPEAYRKCSQAASLHEFVLGHAKFAGCEDSDDYWRRYNPAHVFNDIKAPMLVFNSDDDLLCLRDNIREDWFMNGVNDDLLLLLRTVRGAHLAFNESVFSFNNYMYRVALDFLDSSRRVINNAKSGSE